MPTRVSVAADLERELLTAEDFLEWLDPERFADLIDGEIFVHSAVSIRHADLLNFLDGTMRGYIDRRGLGYLYREAVAVRLSSRNVFLPDLAFYRADRRPRIRDNHVEGAPDLVVEVLSPPTADRDVGPKFAEYEQHGSRSTGFWTPLRSPIASIGGRASCSWSTPPGRPGSIHGPLSGFFVRREWLDPDNLPSISATLALLPGATRSGPA